MFLNNVAASALLVLVLVGVIFTICSSEGNIQYKPHRLRRQTSCQGVEYMCSNRECIPSYNVCDGARDCSDGSDETAMVCKTGTKCPSLAFECSYGACIDREMKCNGQSDCADGSDEKDCEPRPHQPNSSCGPLKFQCSSGQCIDSYDTCDGVKNCNDGSDETKDLCSNLVCPSSSFQCDYGACLEPSVRCNGITDCPDGSDEDDTCEQTITPTITYRPDVQGSCRLPDHPERGAYASAGCYNNDQRPGCRNTPGTVVPRDWLLKYSCKAGYSINKESEYSVCNNGIWKYPLDCIKLCPALKSVSVNVRCVYEGKEVQCDHPMKPNTTATAKCKQHYNPPSHNIEYSKLLCQSNGKWSYSLFECIPDCGLSSKVTVPLIIYGNNNTKLGEFPWLAAIYHKTADDKWDHQCGGTLVSPHLVVTAAHCLVEENGKIPPSGLRVGLGKYYRDFYKTESSSVISKVREVVVPPKYTGSPSFYALDVGLLDLVVSVQVTAFIMPACIDWMSIFKPAPNAEGDVAGWGKTEHGIASEIVLSTRLKFIGYDQCLKTIRARFQRFLTHDKFCAGRIDEGQVDHGDSGGGLTFVNRNGLHYLIGVVSTKIPEETSVTLFTDITNEQHSAWLEGEKNRLRGLHTE